MIKPRGTEWKITLLGFLKGSNYLSQVLPTLKYLSSSGSQKFFNLSHQLLTQRASWCVYIALLQGDPNQNLKFVLAITLKTRVSDPMLVKPKCVWELSVFFNFQKFVYIFQLFVYNFSNKTDDSQTHFGFINIGSEMLIFRVIAKTNFKFWFGSPCI